MNAKTSRFLIFLLIVAAACPLLRAKKAPVLITIVVTEESGGVVPGADIKVFPSGKGLSTYLKTREDGAAKLNLLPGRYDVFVAEICCRPQGKHITVTTEPDQIFKLVMEYAREGTLVRLGDHGPVSILRGTCPPCYLVMPDHPFGAPITVYTDCQPCGPPKEPKTVLVNVLVTDPTGAPVPYPQARIDYGTNPAGLNQGAAQGRLQLEVQPGWSILSVTSAGFTRWSGKVEVRDEENQTFTVVLDFAPKPPVERSRQ